MKIRITLDNQFLRDNGFYTGRTYDVLATVDGAGAWADGLLLYPWEFVKVPDTDINTPVTIGQMQDIAFALEDAGLQAVADAIRNTIDPKREL